MKHFASSLYLTQRRNARAHHYESDPEGYLFAKGIYRTKIKPEDLPQWYVCGCIYQQNGYLSAKDVKYMMYKPNYTTNHIHKDDLLFVSYDKPIEPDEDSTHGIWYHGYEHIVYGHMIVDFLESAKKYSGYDIRAIMREVRKKERWYREQHGE